MTDPGRPDQPYDPAAPSPSTPADSPAFEVPTYEPYAGDPSRPYAPPAYEPPAAYEPPPAYEAPPVYQPGPQVGAPSQPWAQQPVGAAPADEGPGWYLAPPPASALPPETGQPWPPAYPTGPGALPGGQRPATGPKPQMLLAVLGLVVILGLAAVGIAFALRGGDDQQRQASPPSLSVSTPPTAPTTGGSTSGGSSPTSSPTSAPTSPDVSDVTVPAVTAGFRGVLSPKENVAYDVPAGWDIRTSGTLVGFEDNNGKPVAIMHGVSTYKRDACPGVNGSNRGNAGFKTAGTLPPADAVKSGIQVFAEAAALNEDGSEAPVTFGAVTDVKVAQGKIAAKMTTATVTPPSNASCGAPKVVFTGVAFSTPGGGTALFIMYLDQGTPDALSPALAQKIVSSLRPYSG